MKQTLKEAGYRYIAYMGDGSHILSPRMNMYEVWWSNKNHASYGLIYKNTHLEFARSIKLQEALMYM